MTQTGLRDVVRVVVADDSPDMRALLRYALASRTGLALAGEAADGADTVGLVERERPDLVLLDIAMPDMDGLEAAARIREIAPDTRIVMLSAYSASKMAAASLRAGADAYLEKAAPNDELFALIGRLFPDVPMAPAPTPALPEAETAEAESASERRYRLLLDALEEGVLLFDTGGKVRAANFAAARILGLPTSALMGRRAADLGLDGEKGIRTTLETFRPCSNVWLALTRPDGDHRWLLVSARPLTTGWQPAPTEMLVSFVDVTDLHASELRYRVLADVSPMAIFRTDIKGDCVYVNRRWLELSGLTEGEALGTGWMDALHPDDRDRVAAEWADAVAESRPFLLDYRFRRPDGTTVWLQGQASAERATDGEIVGWVGAAADITERVAAEERTRRSEATLADAQRIARLGNWDWDIVANTLAWSDEIYRIFGLTPQEFGATYEAFLASVHPDDRELVTRSVDESLEGLHPYGIDHRIVLPDGAVRYVHEQAEITRDATGRAVRMLGTVQDITEQHQAREATEWLATIVAGTDEAIIAKTLDGIVTHWNPGAERLYGYAADEMVGRPIDVLVPPDRAGEVPEILRRVGRGEKVEQYETARVRKDGTRLDVAVTVSPIVDGAGNVVGASTVARDVTERKRNDEALRVRARQQAAVARLGGDALGCTCLDAPLDRDARRDHCLDTLFIEAVTLVADVLGVEYAKILELLPDGTHLLLRAGVGWRDGLVGRATVGTGLDSQAGYTLQSEHPVVVEDLRTETRFSGPPLLHEHGVVSGLSVVIEGADGPYGVFGAHTTTLRHFTDDDVNFLVATANVVAAAVERARTEAELSRAHAQLQRRALELERSNADLAQFAYVASHDLSEPLRTVSGFANLLAERYRGRLDADADEFLGFITDGTTRMQALIDDLLTYSRVGTRAQPPEPVDVTALAEEVVGALGAAIDQSGATVSVGPLPTVVVDRGQLAQVLQNLLTNAITYVAPDVSPLVHVSAEREPDGWRFVVADNGIGVEARHRARIFGMFQRLHPRDVYPGTGIGLAVCKKIVERHGGGIWVEDNPGGGSRFCFTIPDPHENG